MYSLRRRSDSNVQEKREFHAIMISKSILGKSLLSLYNHGTITQGIWCILQQCTSQHGIHSKQRAYMYRSAQKNNLRQYSSHLLVLLYKCLKKLKLHSNIAYN